MSLSGLITRLKNGTYTVTRTTEGTTTTGRYTPGTASTFTIDASQQPMSGRDLQNLPEAERTNDLRKLWTETELFTRTDTHEADRVEIAGDPYKVIRVDHWDGLGHNHYKAIVSRVGVP